MAENVEELEGIAKEVFKHELKASEKMTDLFSHDDLDQSEEAVITVYRDLMGKVTDPQRKRRIVLLMEQIGQNLGSEKMLLAAEETIKDDPDLQYQQG